MKFKIVIFSILFLPFWFGSQAQNCNRYKISDLKDTIIQNSNYVYFKLSIDTQMQQNTGYTDMYFVDQQNDTLNQYNTWSLYIPDPTINNGFGVSDTVEYVLPYKPGIITFPIPFNGRLIMRNPNCAIDFKLWPLIRNSLDKRRFYCYPNPTSGIIKFNPESKGVITLLNTIGSVILEKSMHKGYIDLSLVPNGLYLLKIKIDHEVNLQKVLIN